MNVYARRLGVIPQSYSYALGYALQRHTGERPTLKALAQLLRDMRLQVWDSAKAAFKAAQQARVWSYFCDPTSHMDEAERQREAWRRFENRNRRRGSRRSAKRRRVRHEQPAAPPTRRSARRPRARLDPDFHWNLQDTYVLDLDEYTAPTGLSMHAAIADRMKRHRLRRLC